MYRSNVVWRNVMRRKWLLRCISASLLLSATLSVQTNAQGSRNQLANAGGVPLRYSIPFSEQLPQNPVADIEVDDITRRVFVSLPAANKVEVFDFGAVHVGSIALATPGHITRAPGAIFVAATGAGTIVRIDPSTLAVTVVASNVPSPDDLTHHGGNLYTIGEFVPDSSGPALIRVHPLSGVQTMVPNDGSGTQLGGFVDPSPRDDVLIGTPPDERTGLIGRNLLMGDFELFEPTIFGSYRCASTLTNGELMLGLLNESAALKFSPMADSLRRWRPVGLGGLNGCDAGRRSVVLSSASTTGLAIEVFDQSDPGRRIRSYSSSSLQVLRGQLKVSPDDSMIVLPTVRNNSVELYLLPGVVPGGPAPSTNSAAVRPRSAAPLGAGAASGRARLSAPGVFPPCAPHDPGG